MKLFKKNGKWWVDFTADGRRHRQSTGTANRKLAEAWMENIQTARRMPTFESAVEVLKLLYSKPVEGRIPIDARGIRADGKCDRQDHEREVRRSQAERDRAVRQMDAREAPDGQVK